MINKVKEGFKEIYHKNAQYVFCAPGRSEISGNHTDHQHGCVLACSINLKTYAAVALNNTNNINIYSNGYKPFSIDLNDLDIKEEEKNNSISLVRGICYKFKSLNENIKGFDAYIDSQVFSGSGLSSSASFEVLFAYIINYLSCNNEYSKIDIAIISQFAENEYFGKPSGLMDQTACAVGGIVYIDFFDIENPVVERIDYDFNQTDYAIVIVDSGGSHENLNEQYASIPNDLKEISSFFNKKNLREVDENEFYSNLHSLREKIDDLKILRAIHIIEENKRVLKQKEALKKNDILTFLYNVKESGNSSYKMLQNVLIKDESKQDLALSLALIDANLYDNGVSRVHGGGFAGTAQVFVKKDYLDEFVSKMNKSLDNEKACNIIHVDNDGVKLLEVLND